MCKEITVGIDSFIPSMKGEGGGGQNTFSKDKKRLWLSIVRKYCPVVKEDNIRLTYLNVDI